MSGLFGMLSSTSKALDTQRYGLDATGQNIANVNTKGYTRRVVDFAAVPPADQRLNAGGGVDVMALRSVRDRFYDRRVLEEVPAEQREAAIADSLSLVEAGLGASGASIDARLGGEAKDRQRGLHLAQLRDLRQDVGEEGARHPDRRLGLHQEAPEAPGHGWPCIEVENSAPLPIEPSPPTPLPLRRERGAGSGSDRSPSPIAMGEGGRGVRVSRERG